MNAKMAELRRCFETAGFADVKTILSSGNVAFTARAASEATLARKAEAAMGSELGHSFLTIVRSVDALQKLIDADPYGEFHLTSKAKRVVTFLRDEHKAKPALPIEIDGARVLAMKGRDVFTAYVPSARGAVFMKPSSEHSVRM